jgi:hypothetical protein
LTPDDEQQGDYGGKDELYRGWTGNLEDGYRLPGSGDAVMPENKTGGWLGIPGILEIRITEGPMSNYGATLSELFKWINIPSLTQVDNDKIEEFYTANFSGRIPSVSIKIFGIYLTDLFPIHELKRMNSEHRSGSWLRLALYFIIVFFVVVVTLLLGKELGSKLLMLIPGAVGFMFSAKASVGTSLWRKEVRAYFKALAIQIQSLDYVSEIVDGVEMHRKLDLIITALASVARIAFV